MGSLPHKFFIPFPLPSFFVVNLFETVLTKDRKFSQLTKGTDDKFPVFLRLNFRTKRMLMLRERNVTTSNAKQAM